MINSSTCKYLSKMDEIIYTKILYKNGHGYYIQNNQSWKEHPPADGYAACAILLQREAVQSQKDAILVHATVRMHVKAAMVNAIPWTRKVSTA